MCIQCLQVCYSVLYSIFSYNNVLWVLTLLLSCCSLLWYGIKPQCISVVQFQKKMWFRVDFLISQSFLFYYFPCCVKKKIWLIALRDFLDPLVSSTLIWAFSFLCLHCLSPAQFWFYSQQFLLSVGPALEGSLGRSVLKVLLQLLQTLAGTSWAHFFFSDSHWYHAYLVAGVVVLVTVLQDSRKYCLVWLQMLSLGSWFYCPVSLSAPLCRY